MFSARTLWLALPLVGIGLFAAFTSSSASAASAQPLPTAHGAPVGQDPYLAPSGNGGYDVTDYTVALTYAPATHGIAAAHAQLSMRSLQPLRLFSLDARPGLRITRVRVDGKKARFVHHGRKLTVDRFPLIGSNQRFRVSIAYHGQPKPVQDPSGRDHYGWLRTPGGAVTFTEPTGTSTWIPSNDIFYDKATWHVSITTPSNRLGVSSGKFLGMHHHGGKVRTEWVQPVPIQPYTQVVAIDDFRYSKAPIAGVPAFTAVAKKSGTTVGVMRQRTAVALDWLRPKLGTYPFPSTGAIVVSGGQSAMETAGRPVYSPENFYTNQSTVVHEQVHQWFGNTVTARDANDMWLHEGFATYLENIEHAERTHASLDDEVHSQYVYDGWAAGFHGQFDRVSLSEPSLRYLLNTTPYFRGQAALHALRADLGDPMFWRVLRGLGQEPAGRNFDTPAIIAKAEAISQHDLTAWANTWVYSRGYQQLPLDPSHRAMLREIGPGILDAAGDYVWDPKGDPKAAIQRATRTYSPMNQLIVDRVRTARSGAKTLYFVDFQTRNGPLYPKPYPSCFVFDRNDNDILAGSFLGVKISTNFRQNTFTERACPTA
jgi:Peptidase family M1 domain